MTKNGIHDFGTGKHYSVISFVATLCEISYWEAAEKIIVDFQLDISKIQSAPVIKEKKENIIVSKIEIVEGKVPIEIKCYFDEKSFYSKPNGRQLAQIKNRIMGNGLNTYSGIEEIADEIINGKTCIPSGIRGSPDTNWKEQQVFMLDFDNKIDGEDIFIEDSKHVAEQMVLDYCKKINLLPTIIYNTFSHTDNQHKFRLVYVFQEPIKDINVAKQIPKVLLDKLERFHPDCSKKNLADMFLGGRNVVYLGENFYKVEMEEN